METITQQNTAFSAAPQTFFMLNAEELKQVIQGFISDYLAREKEKEQSETLYTAEEVTKLLHVSRTTLCKWANKGYLVPIKIGKFTHYKKSEITALMNEQ